MKQNLQSCKSRSKYNAKMKTNLFSNAIMEILHSRGLELAYQSVAANDSEYVHMLQCDCYETCSGGCEGGCWGDCSGDCFDSSR